jgi:hypothetical protein
MSNPEISKKALWLPGFRNLFGPRLGITEFGISLAAGTVGGDRRVAKATVTGSRER